LITIKNNPMIENSDKDILYTILSIFCVMIFSNLGCYEMTDIGKIIYYLKFI